MSAVRSGADLVGRRVTVDVPATTANLGAGFDALALALDLATLITVEAVPPETEPAFHVEVHGEGAGHLPTGRRNRFVSALIEGLADAGVDPAGAGWHVRMDNHIPVTRGLGSSASATVAALVAADALLDGALGPERILELATALGGPCRQRRRRHLRRALRGDRGRGRAACHPHRATQGSAGGAVHPRQAPLHRGHAGRPARDRALRRCGPQRRRGRRWRWQP